MQMQNESLSQNDRLLELGFGNKVPKSRIIGIVGYDSGPVNRHCRELESQLRLIDATRGRKVRCVVYLDSGHAILSSFSKETLSERLESLG